MQGMHFLFYFHIEFYKCVKHFQNIFFFIKNILSDTQFFLFYNYVSDFRIPDIKISCLYST